MTWDTDTIAGYAQRILNIIVWELPATRAPEIGQLLTACRALLDRRDAARFLDAQAGAKRRSGIVRGDAADLIDAVGEP